MFFYRYLAIQGREALIDTLASADPFALPPAKVVERALALGNVLDVTKPVREMWPTIGRVFEVRREKQDFLVAISRDAEEISVQEMRADAYLPIENSSDAPALR